MFEVCLGIWEFTAFVAGLLGIGVIHSVWTYFWKRAKPILTDLNVELGPKPGAETTGEYLRVEVILGNDGHGSFGVHPYAYLAMPLRDETTRPDLFIPLRLHTPSLGPGTVEIIEANKTARLLFYSDEPTHNFKITALSGEVLVHGAHFREILKARIFSRKVALTLAVCELSDSSIVSDAYRFGAAVSPESPKGFREVAMHKAHHSSP